MSQGVISSASKWESWCMSQGVISSEAHKMERLIVQLETGIGNWLSDSSSSTCAFVNRWPRNLAEGILSLTAILRAESFCLSRASCCLRKRFCSLRSQIFFTVKMANRQESKTRITQLLLVACCLCLLLMKKICDLNEQNLFLRQQLALE